MSALTLQQEVEELFYEFSGFEEPVIHDNSEIEACGSEVLLLFKLCISWFEEKTLLCAERTKNLIELARQKFYAYPYFKVPEYWRQLHVDASILRALALLRVYYSFGKSDISRLLDKIVGIIDTTLIMSGAPGRGRSEFLNKILTALPHEPESSIKSPSFNSFSPNPRTFQTKTTLLSLESPSMEEYLSLVRQKKPFVIKSSIDHWPALEKWTEPSYLLELTHGGRRIVPVELGRTYTDDDWGQSLLSFKELLINHVLKSQPTSKTTSVKGARTGYLAQHDLFTQIPQLRRDIDIPDFCYFDHSEFEEENTFTEEEQDQVRLNAWFGPAGTISALHHDPNHNIFAQVVGHKYFRLFSPLQTHSLYPRACERGIDMSNTSQVDVDNPDLTQFPDFAGCPYEEVTLGPGDLLYLPAKWWHYVRSESISFSVSFWYS